MGCKGANVCCVIGADSVDQVTLLMDVLRAACVSDVNYTRDVSRIRSIHPAMTMRQRNEKGVVTRGNSTE